MADQNPSRLRSRVARALVRWVGRWWTASYNAYCDGFPRMEAFFSAGARHAQWIAFPIARRLDREAMVDQMCTECWWG